MEANVVNYSINQRQDIKRQIKVEQEEYGMIASIESTREGR
jgi:hypothetical protein